MLARVTTYVAEVKQRLLTQYKEMPRFRGMLEAFAQSMQLTEDELWKLGQQTSIGDFSGYGSIVTPRTTGVWLQHLADVVGADITAYLGFGAGSDIYRAALIQARILANRSNATTEDVIAMAMLLFENLLDEARDDFPAGLLLFLDPDAEIGHAGIMMRVALGELRRTRPAGVRMQVLGSGEPSSDTFTFSATSAEVADTARGWNDDYSNPGHTIGGVWSYAMPA